MIHQQQQAPTNLQRISYIHIDVLRSDRGIGRKINSYMIKRDFFPPNRGVSWSPPSMNITDKRTYQLISNGFYEMWKARGFNYTHFAAMVRDHNEDHVVRLLVIVDNNHEMVLCYGNNEESLYQSLNVPINRHLIIILVDCMEERGSRTMVEDEKRAVNDILAAELQQYNPNRLSEIHQRIAKRFRIPTNMYQHLCVVGWAERNFNIEEFQNMVNNTFLQDTNVRLTRLIDDNHEIIRYFQGGR